MINFLKSHSSKVNQSWKIKEMLLREYQYILSKAIFIYSGLKIQINESQLFLFWIYRNQIQVSWLPITMFQSIPVKRKKK